MDITLQRPSTNVSPRVPLNVRHVCLTLLTVHPAKKVIIYQNPFSVLHVMKPALHVLHIRIVRHVGSDIFLMKEVAYAINVINFAYTVTRRKLASVPLGVSLDPFRISAVVLIGCRSNFTSSFEHNTCDRCIFGNYGTNCDLSCPQTCASIGCDRLNGVCFACTVGYFGDYCNMSCPRNCRSECDKTTGQCASCKNGFYGGECTIECVINCDSCAMVNGSCLKCADGFFGLSCTNHCSENCLNGKCNMDNGSCLCVPGYIGPVCENKITTTNKDGIGPPLVVPASPQNYVGATVGITLTAVVIVAGLVGLGVWCFKKRINGAGRGNFPVFGMTVNMSDIDKLEGQLSRIDKELNKWTSRRAEVASKLEELKANIPYRNTDRADKVEDRSYEMLQKERSESPYSSIQ